MWLAQTQRLAGDAIGARINAQQARETMEPLYKDQPNDVFFASNLAEVYALLGEKDLALKAAERAIVLASDNALSKHSAREHLARILAMVGENSRAIPILAELLQKPYWSYWYGPPALTPALLRLDPFWDPLRSDPAFQRLCEDKQP
jgi:predicted Zn-dependent protease